MNAQASPAAGSLEARRAPSLGGFSLTFLAIETPIVRK